ncbi:DEAD/DEAH box helicase [Dactylosporangium sp. NPDC050588]|uniref:DEAD/DEAH box helicase n=1 Tax=Dactylosporangium sp. NPDC050588 TaxID=3157211 RepID=UPI0033D27FD7
MTIDNTEAAEAVAPRAPVRPDAPTFADLGARPETVAALEAVGIIHAFAIQEYAVPIALRGTDLIGQAPTGTGKTLGFGVPLLDRVTAPTEGADGLPQALVVVPTRELGLQVARDIAAAGKTRGVRVLPLYGGVAYEPQVDALQKGVEIVVGTPGRLLDLAKSKHLRLHAVRALVLDEADRMLDLGFLDDVERILTLLPEDRQTMLFSATMPDPIVTLARRFLRHPMTIHAHHDASTGPSPLTKQFIYRTHPMNKIEIVARVLQAEDRGLTMIFTRTKRAADRVAEDLDFRGFAAAAVHGDLGQGARERALRAFRAGKIDVLVATDVAARGLDVSGVTHVINYDCPEDQDTYTHRIGRTGRAGATGVAVTFVDWEDMPRWRIIDKTLGMDLAEPPETYHTSAHLLTDIGIPEGITGSLPTADRKRAGLAAEQLEDIEGKPRGRGRTRGRGRGGDSSSSAPATDPTGEPRRPRRRRRRGEVDPAELPLTDTAEATGTSADAGEQSEPRPARTRTRRRQVVEGSDTADTGPVATAEATEDGEPRTARARIRRRRRGGRGKGGEGPATEAGDSPEA